jgi:hypothetical protein
MATFLPNGLQLSGFSPTKFQRFDYAQRTATLSNQNQFVKMGRINPATPFHPWTKFAGFSGYFL